MAWQDELVPLLRVLIDDADEASQRYTDDRLEQLLAVAALQVSVELDFPVAFTVSAADAAITPDPTDADAGTRDDNFVNLTTIKAACILDRGTASKAAGQAIRIKDGSSEIDLRGVPAAKAQLLKLGWCAVYADEKADYVTGQQGGAVGAAVLSPFRLFAGWRPANSVWARGPFPYS